MAEQATTSFEAVKSQVPDRKPGLRNLLARWGFAIPVLGLAGYSLVNLCLGGGKLFGGLVMWDPLLAGDGVRNMFQGLIGVLAIIGAEKMWGEKYADTFRGTEKK